MTILAEITNEKHREVENLPLIQKIMAGNATVDEYFFYLYELYHIYAAIEGLAEDAGILEGLTDIRRQDKIRIDLDNLKPNYTHRQLLSSTYEYFDHLKEISGNENTRHLLLAHIYVRHMGDLYGGKLMARVIPGSGFAYQFEDRPKLIKELSDRLTMDLADEANKTFDYFIKIFTQMGNELQNADI